MPELPEVETVRAGLEQAVRGKTIANVTLRRGDLRTPFPPAFAEQLAGKNIEAIERRGKYLLFTLDKGLTLLAHLGMSGRFTVLPEVPKALHAHDHVVFSFTDGAALLFHDPRRFGLMDMVKTAEIGTHPLLAKLGPEPFSPAFSPAYLKGALARRKGPIKPALMDAGLVVGVGNIYASEALFAAKISPKMPANAAARHAKALVQEIRQVLKKAIDSGGSSLRDFFRADGSPGYFQHDFAVYGREGKPCYRCNTLIASFRQAGRTTFYCPACQA